MIDMLLSIAVVFIVYVNLIQENQVDINEQIGQDGSDFSDIPF